jgi:hypothetical protein
MIHSLSLIQTTVGAWADFSHADKLLVKMLPVIGICVVLGGLAVLAIVLSQFYRLAGKDAQKPAEPAPAPAAPVVEKKPEASAAPASELELVAAMTGLSLYLNESTDKICLTEVKQYYNNNPWTSESMAKQARRFKRWQAVKK